MAVRAPLYYTGGNLKEMTSAEVDQIISQAIYQYSQTPSVALSVIASGGNVGSITDTRQQAGAMSTHNSSFPNEATTEEPTTVTITYDKINQTPTSGSTPTDSGKTWPVYKTAGGDIQSMTLQDVKDTFIHPAIDKLVAATTTTEQGGTYHINTATSVAGSTLVDATPIYVNTQADTTAYTNDAAGLGQNFDKSYASLGASGTNTITVNNVISLTVGMTIFRQDNSTLPDKATSPTYIIEINTNTLTLSQNFTGQASGTYTIGGEALDQPTTIQNYYLHRVNGADNTLTRNPIYIMGGNDLRDYTEVAFETLLASHIKYTAAASVDGFKITYSYTTGTNRGTGMADTILTGTGDYQTHQVDGDDYRAQEFPNGSANTANTWYLKINKS
jgi:hypothetical protein